MTGEAYFKEQLPNSSEGRRFFGPQSDAFRDARTSSSPAIGCGSHSGAAVADRRRSGPFSYPGDSFERLCIGLPEASPRTIASRPSLPCEGWDQRLVAPQPALSSYDLG
jgi:hypothetical protein